MNNIDKLFLFCLSLSIVAVLAGCAAVPAPVYERPVSAESVVRLPAAQQRLMNLEPGVLQDRDVGNSSGMTVEDLVREVLLNNPDLLADFARFEALLQKIPQVTELPDPMFNYTYFVEEVQTRTGEQEFIIGLSQRFPWFGKIELRGKIAGAEAMAALEAYRVQMLDLTQQTRKAWHQLAFEHAAFDLKREEKIYLEQFLEAASAAYAAGNAGRQAELKAQTELARIDNDLLSFPARIRALEAELNRLRDAAAEQALPRPADIAPQLLDLDSTDFLAEAIARRPELAQIEQQLEKNRLAYELAKKDYFPDVTLAANYINVSDRPDDPDARISGEGDDAWSIAVLINLPLRSARRRAQLAEVQKQEEEAALRKIAMEKKIASDLTATLSALRSLNDQLIVYEDSLILLAQETFETSQAEYTAGNGSFLDLLDAERTLLCTRLAYLTIERDYQLALADLERILGSKIEIETDLE